MSKTRSEQCPGRMTPVIDICVLLAKRETKLFSLLNAWAEKTPLLGKGGVDAPSRKIPVPIKGADGVVRSNSKQFFWNQPPRLRRTWWLRSIFLMAQPPLLCQALPKEGTWLQPQPSATTKCVYFTGLYARGYELALGFSP